MAEMIDIPGSGPPRDHTYNDLYEHRMLLTASLFNAWHEAGLFGVHKSTKYHDGEYCFGGSWMVVAASVPGIGQLSYRYPVSAWDLFLVPSKPRLQWALDDHTAETIALRLRTLIERKRDG